MSENHSRYYESSNSGDDNDNSMNCYDLRFFQNNRYLTFKYDK